MSPVTEPTTEPQIIFSTDHHKDSQTDFPTNFAVDSDNLKYGTIPFYSMDANNFNANDAVGSVSENGCMSAIRTGLHLMHSELLAAGRDEIEMIDTVIGDPNNVSFRTTESRLAGHGFLEPCTTSYETGLSNTIGIGLSSADEFNAVAREATNVRAAKIGMSDSGGIECNTVESEISHTSTSGSVWGAPRITAFEGGLHQYHGPDISQSTQRREPKCAGTWRMRDEITTQDWEEYRPFLEQLYIVEEMKLKDVMQALRVKFGFVATQKMYKTKINQWGLRKNYKAKEKEHLLRVFKNNRDIGNGMPRLTLRNRPMKLHRLRRHGKKEKLFEEILDDLRPASPKSPMVYQPPGSSAAFQVAQSPYSKSVTLNGCQRPMLASIDSGRGLFDPERPFSTASVAGRTELVLWNVRNYYSRRLSSTAAEHIEMPKPRTYTTVGNSIRSEEAERSAAIIYDKLHFGVGLVIQPGKVTQGYQIIDQACKLMSRALELQGEKLLRYLIDAFTDEEWLCVPDLKTHVLRYFTKLSVAKLGCKHPLSIFLYHMQEAEILAAAGKPVYLVLMAVYKENFDATDVGLWRLRDDYCRILRKHKDYAAAESYGMRFLKEAQECYGRNHERTRSLLYKLGRVHYSQGLHEIAESEFKDVLQRGREDAGDSFPDRDRIYVLRSLAWICEHRRDLAESEGHWRAALQGAVERWGIGDEKTIFMISDLEESLAKLGLNPKAWLQQHFGICGT